MKGAAMPSQDIALPRVAGTLPTDATPEQRIVAGLVFDARPGHARADARPSGMQRLVQPLRLRMRYALADAVQRAQMQRARSLQQTNCAMGTLLEQLAASPVGPLRLAPLRASLERLSRAVAAAGQYETAGLVLRVVARAHMGQLDTEVLFALRAGLLRSDPNDRELLLAGITFCEERTNARHTLQTIRQAVDEACACRVVQGPLDALVQLSGIRGPVPPQQGLQIDHQLGRLREGMNHILDTRAAVRADLVQADIQHTLRARFLAPAVGRLKTSDLLRLRSVLEIHGATFSQYGSQSLLRAYAARMSIAELAEPFGDEFNEGDEDAPQGIAPGFRHDVDGVVYDTPHENTSQTGDYETPGMVGSLRRRPSSASAAGRRRNTVSMHGCGFGGYGRGQFETPELASTSAGLAETSFALRTVLTDELALRGHNA
jgi:hypothetical protein